MSIRTLVCLGMVSLASCTWGQQTVTAPALSTQPAAPKGPSPLDVVVTDKKGHPIPGLQHADFTLLDNGQPTPIGSFEAIDQTGADAASAQSAPTQVVLVIDEVNTDFQWVSTAREQLHNFLTQNQGHLAFPISVDLVTDTSIKQMNQPTTDGNAIDAQLRQEQGTLRAIPRSAGFYGGTDRLEISLQSLNKVAGSLATVPGRKILVWISPGWGMFNGPNVIVPESQRRAFFAAVVGFSNALQQDQITLDAVNPGGTENAAAFNNFEWQDFLKPPASPKKTEPGDVALQVLATHTGGQVLFGSNDIAAEVRTCVEDGLAWYRLTFVPQHAEQPDTWHSLLVKLDKPGLKVRTSYGYYAQP